MLRLTSREPGTTRSASQTNPDAASATPSLNPSPRGHFSPYDHKSTAETTHFDLEAAIISMFSRLVGLGEDERIGTALFPSFCHTQAQVLIET
jgi:hypothetical protein